MRDPAEVLIFESTLVISRADLWARITDFRRIREETMPVLAMTHPREVVSLAGLGFTPGRRLFRSVLLLGGVVPFDRSDLTLVEFEPQHRFVERSPMLSMTKWQHRREILARADDPTRHVLRDTLEFVPRIPRFLAVPFVRFLFRHRHAVLRRAHGGA